MYKIDSFFILPYQMFEIEHFTLSPLNPAVHNYINVKDEGKREYLQYRYIVLLVIYGGDSCRVRSWL